MKVEELIGYLHALEMNLKQRKKEKTIAFKLVEDKTKDVDSNDEDDGNELELLTKNFHHRLGKKKKTMQAN